MNKDAPDDAIYSLDFFQALRLIECQHPDQPRLGTSWTPREEPLRIGQDCSMAFAPSSMTSWTEADADTPARLGVAFLGLLGPNGPLPLHLTDHALERQRRHKDKTFLRFLNLFEHRFLIFFYRAWSGSQPAVSYDRPQEDHFANYVASLMGLGFKSLRNRDGMQDNAKLHFAGLMLDGCKHPEGLVSILQGYLDVTVRVIELVGEWLQIAVDEQCQLGTSVTTGLVGENAIIGSSVFECQHKFRIQLGPLTISQFEAFLPGQPSMTALRAAVRNYVGDQYRWDVQLLLKKEEITPIVLGGTQARLGWTSWLGHWTRQQDADDVILDPEQHAD